MKRVLFLLFLALNFVFADPSSYLIDIMGDDGEKKCIFMPFITGGGCCSGNSSTNCTRNIEDSFAVMTNRVDNNLRRLNARWKEISDEYALILAKSIPMTENILQEEEINSDETLYIFKNVFESEKYNKLLENEVELNNLGAQLIMLEHDIDRYRNSNKK